MKKASIKNINSAASGHESCQTWHWRLRAETAKKWLNLPVFCADRILFEA
jgi:hypothetical protein